MGDRHYSFPDSLAVAVLAFGLKGTEAFKDEIYCQVSRNIN